MLIIGRKENEPIYLDVAGVRIEIQVVEIKSLRSVRIGIDAPECVKITRHDAVSKERRRGDAN